MPAQIAEQKEYCGQATRQMTPEEILRQKARDLREQSVRLDKFADEISRFSFSFDASQELYLLLTR